MLTNQESIAQIKKVDLDAIPVAIPGTSAAGIAKVSAVADAARQITQDLDVVFRASTEQQRTLVRRRVQAQEEKLDSLIYDLYELNSSEIAVVDAWKEHMPLI